MSTPFPSWLDSTNTPNTTLNRRCRHSQQSQLQTSSTVRWSQYKGDSSSFGNRSGIECFLLPVTGSIPSLSWTMRCCWSLQTEQGHYGILDWGFHSAKRNITRVDQAVFITSLLGQTQRDTGTGSHRCSWDSSLPQYILHLSEQGPKQTNYFRDNSENSDAGREQWSTQSICT